MTTPLPSYVATGTVKGRQVVISGDTTADVDTEPDAAYPVGAVLTFTPSVPYLVFPKETATPNGATVYLNAVTATVDASGNPATTGGDALKLVANLGQVGNDQDWHWLVTVKIGSTRYPQFLFDVTAGVDNFLSDQQAIPATTVDSAVVRGPAGPAGPPGDGTGGVSYLTDQSLTTAQVNRALRNVGAAQIIEPEKFNTGSDQGNLQACLDYGASSTDFVRINLRSKAYTIGTSGSSAAGLTYDGTHGSVHIDARGAQIIYQGTGSLLSANVQTGSNNPPRITTQGGYWEGLTAAFGFDGTDIRTFTYIEPDVYFPVGAAFRQLNRDIWCERNTYERVRDNGSKQLLVCDVADFVSTSIAVTFTASNNQVSFAPALHKSAVGDRMKFTGMTGGAGITSGATYYVQSVVSTTVVTLAATVGGAQVDITSNGTGSGWLQPAASMARTRVFEAKLTGGVATFCKIQIKNGAGCYDSHFSGRGNIPDGVGVIDVLGAGTLGDTDIDFRCEPVSTTAGGAFLMRAGQAGGFPPTLSPALDVDRLNMFDPLAAAPDGTALIFGQHKFRGFESQTYRTNSFTDFYGRTGRTALGVPINPSVWITSALGTGVDGTFGNMVITPASGKHIYTDVSGGTGTAVYQQLDTLLDASYTSNATVRTNDYTAVAGELVRVRPTSWKTVTLPTAPQDGTRIAVKNLSASGGVEKIACGGSDVFNETSGPTAMYLSEAGATVHLQYVAALALWLVVAYTPGSPVFKVSDYGAKGDGATDDYTAIAAAIAAAATRGGGTVLFPPGTFLTGSEIVITSSGIKLVGAGAPSGIYQGTPTYGTVLKRTGATAGDVIRFQTSTSAATAISDCGVEGMSILGNDVATGGLTLKSVQWSTFKNLHIRNCLTTAIDEFIETVITDGVEDVQGNIFDRISITQTSASSASGIGIRLDGTQPTGNTSVNKYTRVSVLHKNGVGIKLLNADSNYFSSVLIARASGGSGIGVEFNGSAVSGLGHARSNMFSALDPGAGGVTARGTSLTQPSVNNWIVGYSVENGAPLPTIEAGASLFTTTNTGVMTGSSLGLRLAAGSSVTATPVVGSPEGGLTANVGSLALRTDGTSRTALLVKGSGTGNTGWLPVSVDILSNVSATGGLTATYTVVNAASGAATMTLPTAVGIQGKPFTVKKSDSSGNAVIINTTSSQTIDGVSSYTLTYQWQSATFVSDGTNWVLLSVPRATPATSFIRDEFVGGSTGSTAVGELGWTLTNGTLTTVTAVANHPGIFNHSVTTSGQVASLRLGGANDGDVLPADFFDMTWVIRLNSNDTATDFRVGLGSASGTAPPAGAIVIEKAFADTSWFGVTRSASTQTRTAALATVSAATWVKFRMRRIDASTIGFSVDGGTELTSTTNIPTAGLSFFTQISNNTGAAKNFDIDYFECTYGLTR